MIWYKVALDESDIEHRLTQITRNTVLPERLQNLRLNLANTKKT